MTQVSQVERFVARKGRVLTVADDASVAVAAKGMTRHGIGCLVVTDQNRRVAGMLSERDILAKVVASGIDPGAIQVADVMTRRVVSCPPDTTVPEAMQIMDTHGFRHLPIIEGHSVRGMISIRDILAYRIETTDALADRQADLLHKLERRHPGITRLDVDPTGRLTL
jgi:CBS domain-containing protein